MAYGHVPRPAGSKSSDLRPRIYPLPDRAKSQDRAAVLCVPFSADGTSSVKEYDASSDVALRAPEALVQMLAEVFNEELERGVTYPQRGPLSLQEFRDYFLGYDLIVAFFLPSSSLGSSLSSLPITGTEAPLSTLLSSPSSSSSLDSLDSLDFRTTVAGCFYIKPNYPGRSSHICNAGFVVPPSNRGLGLGGVLGQSFLHFGPKAGYRASVFNLVYENNVASVRIWQRLGFSTVGRIPAAGSLRRADGKGEELVDALVIYRDFVGGAGVSEGRGGDKVEEVKDGSAVAL